MGRFSFRLACLCYLLHNVIEVFDREVECNVCKKRFAHSSNVSTHKVKIHKTRAKDFDLSSELKCNTPKKDYIHVSCF